MKIETTPTDNMVMLSKEGSEYYNEEEDEFEKEEVLFKLCREGQVFIDAPSKFTILRIEDFEEVVRVYRSYFNVPKEEL
jgi:hypothetical protein